MTSSTMTDLSVSLNDLDISKCSYSDQPDEILLMIYQRLPLWSFKSLAKVDKRNRRLVHDYARGVTVIEAFDIAYMTSMIFSDILNNREWSHVTKDEFFRMISPTKKLSVNKFKESFFQMVSTFENVIEIGADQKLIDFIGIEKFGRFKFCQKLADINPDLRLLFMNENDPEVKFFGPRSNCHQYDLLYMHYVLEKNPKADPLCDQVISSDRPDWFKYDIFDRYPHLSCKIYSKSLNPFFQDRFLDRLVGYGVFRNNIESISHILPNMRQVTIMNAVDTNMFKSQMMKFFPNVTCLCDQTSLSNHLEYADYESNILELQSYGNNTIGIENLKKCYQLLKNPRRNVELITLVAINMPGISYELNIEISLKKTRACVSITIGDLYLHLQMITNQELIFYDNIWKHLFPQIPEDIYKHGKLVSLQNYLRHYVCE